MWQPENKNSNEYWFYEMRPYLILAFGILGVFNKQNPTILLPFLSQVCGIVLLYLGATILRWRHDYRKVWKHR